MGFQQLVRTAFGAGWQEADVKRAGCGFSLDHSSLGLANFVVKTDIGSEKALFW